MKNRKLLAVLAVLLVAGCAPPQKSELRLKLEEWASRLVKGEGHALLAQGLAHYEAGHYAEAAASLYAALAHGLPGRERVAAHKHLAFIYCAAGIDAACAHEFRKALRADPAMELDAAEAAHPGWGPVFQQVKLERF